MQYLLGIIIGFLVLLIITRPLTTLLHELGHAIPVMLMTKVGASVFVGSYGDKKQCFKIVIGSLDLWFRYNPLRWRGGLCIPKATNVSLNKQIVYILGGPVFSLLAAAIICYLAFFFDLHGALKLICLFAFCSTVGDFFANLVPRMFSTSDGSLLYSDGYLLLKLRKLKKFSLEYERVSALYFNKEYVEAAIICDNLTERGLVSDDFYRMASTAHIFSKNYERARVFQQKLENEFKLNSNDCYNFGLIYMHLKQEDNKKYYLNKSLELNPDNPYTLNAIGYELTREHRYDEALEFLEKTIRIQPDFAYAYNNRGHAKIELGQVEEGLIDIEESMRLDNTNSYVFRNLGIYHLTRNEKEEAMKYLLQSREMDKDTDLIEELILRAS